MSSTTATLEQAARIMREAVRDKSYQLTPIGEEIKRYLLAKHMALRPSSRDDLESILHKLALYTAGMQLRDFEPPVGTELLEEFLAHQWGDLSGRTYNKALVYVHGFFEWCAMTERLHGDPTLRIRKAKTAAVHREIYSEEQCLAILANANRRDGLCLRLLLHYALRKGALASCRFRHFDHQRRTLTIETKGEKIQQLPLVEAAFWMDLERHILDVGAEEHHHLLPGFTRGNKPVELPEQPRSGHKMHDWWYERLEDAGIVATGQRRGERMHKARHTAIQRVLDKTGNLKAAQKLAGHASMQTTADIYTDWDVDRLAATMAGVLGDG